MKISKGALLFLILATALGPPAQASFRSSAPAVRRCGDCCLSYTSPSFLCKHMKDYVRRIVGCFLPAILFTTNKGDEFCASPQIQAVEWCMEDMDAAKRQKNVLVEKKLQ
ncbi:C-C motif chemokine 5-like [Phyllostomus hastatus]|uniref:C-C motif chemokine 5-like n=1 Tax=Phyllostomus hastatus TaxID=9423 RepID=UPI001E67F681|nr:C-C motif chemokine 5-like [Phyllostomus hastatus]